VGRSGRRGHARFDIGVLLGDMHRIEPDFGSVNRSRKVVNFMTMLRGQRFIHDTMIVSRQSHQGVGCRHAGVESMA
jgi:hypothetical protein